MQHLGLIGCAISQHHFTAAGSAAGAAGVLLLLLLLLAGVPARFSLPQFQVVSLPTSDLQLRCVTLTHSLRALLQLGAAVHHTILRA